MNVYQENIFHTKMIVNELDLDNYLFGVDADDLKPSKQKKIRQQVETEMLEIFYGKNLPR